MRLGHVQKTIEVEEIEVEEDKVVGEAPIEQRPNIIPDCDRRVIVSIWRYSEETASGTEVRDRRIMAKRSKHSFIKFQKELTRKKKAKEKLAQRQGKKDQATDVDKP